MESDIPSFSSLRCWRVGVRFTFLLLTLANFSITHGSDASLEEEFLRKAAAGKRDAAVAVLQEMLVADSQNPLPYRLLAFEARKTQRYEGAAEAALTLGVEGPARTYGLGLVAHFRRDYEEAAKLLQEAVDLFGTADHEIGRGYALHALGETLRWKGRRPWDDAEAAFRESHATFSRIRDQRGTALALEGLAVIEYKRKEYDEALRLHGQAREIREELGKPIDLADSWLWLGRTLRLSGDAGAALPNLERSLELRREAGDLTGEHTTLIELAFSHWTLRDHEATEARFHDAIDVATRLGGELRVAWDRTQFGRYLSGQGRTREAIEMLRLAVASAEDWGHWEDTAKAYFRLGAALTTAGELVTARESLERAVGFASGHERGKQIEADALNELGRIDIAEGELARALQRQLRALDLQRELGDRSKELASLNVLGVAYYWLGRPATATEYFEKLLEEARSLEDLYHEQLALLNIANVLVDDDAQVEQAVEQFRAATKIAAERKNDYDVAYARMGTAYALWRAGKGEEANEVLKLALDAFVEQEYREGEVMALNLAARLAADSGGHDEALEKYASAAEIARERGFQVRLRNAHEGRAAVFEQLGKPEEALVEYRAALDVIESLRARLSTGDLKMDFAAGKAATYEKALALQLALESKKRGAPASFVLAERARARSLLDLLAESRSALRESLPPELLAKEKTAVDELGFAAQRLAWAEDSEALELARSELKSAEEALQAVKLEIRRSAPRYSELAYPEPVPLAELQAHALRPGETLLRYFIGAERSGVWIVSREGAAFQALPAPERLEALVAEYLRAAGRASVVLGSRVPGAAEAAELADALQLSRLPRSGRLLVVPDGPLHLLPFETLPRNGRLLIEDHEIVVVPSASALKLMREKPIRVADGGFLGVGAPESPGADQGILPALPYAGQALDKIAALFPEDRRVVLKGKAVSKASLEEQPTERFRYVHFATHGRLDPRNPRYLGLQLGMGTRGKEPEFLYPEDVFRMRLAADMVVLSACSSGLGELLEGEGIVGMTRGFLYAGARSVLVTLWDVNDKSTAEFMEAFYKKIAEGTPAAEALRSVKLEFLSDEEQPARRQPYRWAPFVLMGDPPAARGESNRRAETRHQESRGGRTHGVR